MFGLLCFYQVELQLQRELQDNKKGLVDGKGSRTGELCSCSCAGAVAAAAAAAKLTS